MTPPARHRRNNFHAVRLLAAIAVLFGHGYAVMGRACEPLVECRLGYTNASRLAVDTFFVISGFLITQSWLSDADPFRFFVRRAARILPGLFVSVLIVALVIGPLETNLPVGVYLRSENTMRFLSWGLLWPGPFALPGVFQTNKLPIAIATLWTLPIEFICYLAVLVAGMLGAVNRRVSLLCLALSGMACAILPTSDLSFRYAECAVYFAAGNVMFLFREKLRFSTMASVLIGIGAVLAHGWLQKLLLLGGLPYVVMSVALSETPFISDLERIGDFSYAIYLYAFPVQQMLVRHTATPMENILASLGCVLVIAVLSWNYVEAPAKSWAMRHIYRLRPAAV